MEFFLCFASSETLSKHSIDPPQYLIFQNRERKVSVEKEGGGGSIHSNLNVRGLSHVVVADGARFQI